MALRTLNDLDETNQDWQISHSQLFAESLSQNIRVFPDLKEKLAKFIQVKLPNPMSPDARYGKHDKAMTAPLAGYYHCHLRDDAILIYRLTNRCICLLLVVTHADIEGKRLKQTVKRLSAL